MTADDGLVVSHGAAISVETDTLFALAAAMARLQADCDLLAGRASVAARVVSGTPLAAPFDVAAGPLVRAGCALREAGQHAGRLSRGVAAAAEGYEAAERRAGAFDRAAGALIGFAAGVWTRHALLGLLPIAGWVVPLALAMQHPAVRRAVAVLGDRIAGPLVLDPALLGNPAVVGLIRALVSSVDDAAMGVAGVPLPLAALLGESGTGLVGLGTAASAASAAMALGAGQALAETPITVKAVGASPVRPPSTLAEAARRIPPAEAGEPQVRVERYEDDEGATRYAVYVAGTADFHAVPGDEPFDMTSNIAGVAGSDAAAQRAVEEAMRRAGVTDDDPVTIFGHSQGGLVAARIAASESFQVDAIVTFGAPAGQIDVPSSVTQLAVEHTDDLVPALGGIPLTDASGSDRVVVSRRAFPTGPDPEAGVLPAHAMVVYQETAEAIDATDDPRIGGLLASIPVIGLGAVAGRSVLYRAERTR